jgi:hypothetical protein
MLNMNLLTKNIIKFLKANKIPVAKDWLQKTIESHPDFPSLLCISETLNIAGIYCIAHKIEISSINGISLPALFHMQNDNIIVITNKKSFTEKLLSEITGIVINVHSINLSSLYKSEVNKERKINQTRFIAIALTTLLLTILFFEQNKIANTIMVLCSIAGLYICFQIFWKENGNAAMWANTACKALGDGCDKVFKSTLSKGILGVKIVDAAIVYFFTLLLFSILEDNLLLIYYAILLAIPIIIFSIIYQKTKVKGWCALCLIVGLIVFIQVLLVWYTKEIFYNKLTLSNVIHFGIYGLISFVWFQYKFFYKLKEQNIQTTIDYQKIRRDAKNFISLLQSEKTVKYLETNTEMIFGNVFAPLQILIVCQPYCIPCANTHKQIDEVIKNHRENICLRIVWLANNESSVKAVSLIFDVVSSQTKENALLKVEEWFSLMNYERYLNNNIISTNQRNSKINIDEQNEWVTQNKIVVTPTIFINNHQIPKIYTIEDIGIMIPNLLEIMGVTKLI